MLAVTSRALPFARIGPFALCVLHAASLSMLGLAGAAEAGESSRIEVFTGFEATDNAESGYLGFGYAFRNGLYESGWRLRAVTSLGRYDYSGSVFGNARQGDIEFDGDSLFGSALLGYQLRAGSLFVKLFAGVEAEDHEIQPRDPQNSVQGSKLGARFVAESWYELSPRWVFSLDAAYGTAFEEYWSLARMGYRLRPRLTIGLEGGALGNQEYDAGRAGGFGRIDIRDLQVTLSGGFTGNYLEDEPSGYISLGVYRPF